MKKRLDLFLYETGYFPSKSKAKDAIQEKKIKVDGKIILKPGLKVSGNKKIEIIKNDFEYVSRGGLKLQRAIEFFSINVENKIALDVGSSTGGFVECLLEKKALKIYAIDVGNNQLHEKIRNKNNVKVLEKTDFRDFVVEKNVNIDLITIDVSFISVKLLMKKIAEISAPEIIVLIKPQFEVGYEISQKSKGVINDEEIRKQVVEEMVSFFKNNNYDCQGVVESPIKGREGNIEYLAYFKKG